MVVVSHQESVICAEMVAQLVQLLEVSLGAQLVMGQMEVEVVQVVKEQEEEEVEVELFLTDRATMEEEVEVLVQLKQVLPGLQVHQVQLGLQDEVVTMGVLEAPIVLPTELVVEGVVDQ